MSLIADYQQLYHSSLEDIHHFWLDQAAKLAWEKIPIQSLEYVWEGGTNTVEHKWFADGSLNVSVNCLDRHLQNEQATKLALIWQGHDADNVRKITYQQLHRMVCRIANVLLRKGIKKGDRVVIYLPINPETIACMLACARLGIISILLLAHKSTENLKKYLQDSGATLLITQDEYFHEGKWLQSKSDVDVILKDCAAIKFVILIKQGAGKCTLYRPRDSWWHHEMEETSHHHQAVSIDSLSPLFISYQGNSENTQGLVYSMGSFLVYACAMFPFVFKAQENNTFGNNDLLVDDLILASLIYGTLSHGFTLMLQENFSFVAESNSDLIVNFIVNDTIESCPGLGIDPIILNESGAECNKGENGKLFLKRPWPGIAQTLWGNHDGFIKKYFSEHPLYYCTGW